MVAPTKTMHLLFDENIAAEHVLLEKGDGTTKIVVKGYQFFGAGAVGVTIKSAGDRRAGPYELSGAGSFDSGVFAPEGEFLFETAANEDLIVSLDDAVRVTGWIVVEQG